MFHSPTGKPVRPEPARVVLDHGPDWLREWAGARPTRKSTICFAGVRLFDSGRVGRCQAFGVSAPPVERVGKRQVPEDLESISVAGHDLLDAGRDAGGRKKGVVNASSAQPKTSHPLEKEDDSLR